MSIALACAAERNYVGHSAVMLLSAIEAVGDERISIHYTHPPGLPRRARRGLEGLIRGRGHEITFIEVPDSLCKGLPTTGFTRKATWYRIFLPDLLGTDRVIYLDSDALVLDSLQGLWEVDLEGNLLAAVANVFQHDHVGRPRELGIPDGQDYFNAGVLVLDLGAMRQAGSSQELRRFSTANADRLAWRDQDALNLVLGDRRKALHPRWNLMNSILTIPAAEAVFGREAIAEAERDPAVRHFEGPGSNKPWHEECERPMRELYLRLRKSTPWPVVRAESPLGRARARVEGSA